MKSRPTTVMILIALAVSGGILSLLSGWWLMLGGTLLTAVGADHGVNTLILGSLLYAVGLTSFLVAYGFWRVKAWAWGAALVVVGVGVAVNAASIVVAGANPLDVVVSMGLGGVTVWYLLQPRARMAFAR